VLLGTTLIVWAVVEDWPEVPGLWTVPHTVPGLALVGGPSNAGGLFIDWVRRLVGDAPVDGVDPGDVPSWEPYLRGERVPLHDSTRRAELRGLALHHGGAHIVRAAHEASGFVARRMIERSGAEARRLVVTGGGTRAGAWVQAMADATGLPADVVAVPEGAALGSAFIARCVAGLEGAMTDASRWASVARTVDPDPAWVEACSARYDSW
jgi:xylulokinase